MHSIIKILVSFTLLQTTLEAAHFDANIRRTSSNHYFYYSEQVHIRILPGGKPFLAIPNPQYNDGTYSYFFYLVGPQSNLAYPFILLDLERTPTDEQVAWKTCLARQEILYLVFAFSNQSHMEVYLAETFFKLPNEKKKSFMRVDPLVFYPTQLQTVALKQADTPLIVTLAPASSELPSLNYPISPSLPAPLIAPALTSQSPHHPLPVHVSIPPLLAQASPEIAPLVPAEKENFSHSNHSAFIPLTEATPLSTPSDHSSPALPLEQEHKEDEASPITPASSTSNEALSEKRVSLSSAASQKPAKRSSREKRSNRPHQQTAASPVKEVALSPQDEALLREAIEQADKDRATLAAHEQAREQTRQQEEQQQRRQKFQAEQEKKVYALYTEACHPHTTAAKREERLLQIRPLLRLLNQDSFVTIEMAFALNIHYGESIPQTALNSVQEKISISDKQGDQETVHKGRICYFISQYLLKNLQKDDPSLSEKQEVVLYWLKKGAAYGEEECQCSLLPAINGGDAFENECNAQLEDIEGRISEEIEQGIRYKKLSEKKKANPQAQFILNQKSLEYFKAAKDACHSFPDSLQKLLNFLTISFHAQEPLDTFLTQIEAIIHETHPSITASKEDRGAACHSLYQYLIKRGHLQDALHLIEVGKKLGDQKCITYSDWYQKKNVHFTHFPENETPDYYDKLALDHLDWAEQESSLHRLILAEEKTDAVLCELGARIDHYHAHLDLAIRCCQKGNKTQHNRALMAIAQLKRGNVFTEEHRQILQNTQTLEPTPTFPANLLDKLKVGMSQLFTEQNPVIGQAMLMYSYDKAIREDLENMRAEFLRYEKLLETCEKQHKKKKPIHDNIMIAYQSLGSALIISTITIPPLPSVIKEHVTRAMPLLERTFALIEPTKLIDSVLSAPVAPCLIPFVLAQICTHLKKLPAKKANQLKALLKQKFVTLSPLMHKTLSDWQHFPTLQELVYEQEMLLLAIGQYFGDEISFSASPEETTPPKRMVFPVPTLITEEPESLPLSEIVVLAGQTISFASRNF